MRTECHSILLFQEFVACEPQTTARRRNIGVDNRVEAMMTEYLGRYLTCTKLVRVRRNDQGSAHAGVWSWRSLCGTGYNFAPSGLNHAEERQSVKYPTLVGCEERLSVLGEVGEPSRSGEDRHSVGFRVLVAAGRR